MNMFCPECGAHHENVTNGCSLNRSKVINSGESMSKVEKALKVVEQLYSTINQYEYQAGVYGTPITLGMWITEAKHKIKKYEKALEVIAGGLDMSNALEDPYEYSTLRDEVLKVQEEARLALGMEKMS